MQRLIDIIVSLSALVVLLPILVVAAIAVAIDSPGNPLYGGWRVGKDEKRFRMWKFRTMVLNADRIGPGITGARDSRFTRIGPFLRATKIDELPQFINVLLGDMSLIGPRPEIPDMVARYLPHQKAVLRYRPGITGAGALHYTQTQADQIPDGPAAEDYYVKYLLDDKLAIEIEYEKKRNVVSDLKVIAATVQLMIQSAVGSRSQQSA